MCRDRARRCIVQEKRVDINVDRREAGSVVINSRQVVGTVVEIVPGYDGSDHKSSRADGDVLDIRIGGESISCAARFSLMTVASRAPVKGFAYTKRERLPSTSAVNNVTSAR